jgi:hypothetical protein
VRHKPTIDQRTRFQGDSAALEPAWLLEQLPDVLQETGTLAARGVRVLELPPLGFEVEGVTAHLAVEDGRLAVREGSASGGPIAALDAVALSDLMQDVVSTFGLVMPGRVTMRRGTTDDFQAWEPVLRAALDERPVYEPGSVTFRARDGGQLDLRQSFRVDDPGEDVGHFLSEAGFLHLEGVFTEAEMALVSADLDEAVAAASEDDGASWWARTEDEGWYASRILGFNFQSPTLQDLLSSERFAVIGTFTGDRMVQRSPRHGDSAEGLLKKVGVVEGISDVSWHKDCSMGGHSRGCSGMVVGISVTGAGPANGELGVVAGSTRTGDCTVHCSCTLHMSRPPVEFGRRAVYTGFSLAPRPGDVVTPLDPEEKRRARHALNDQVRARQGDVTVDRDSPGAFSLPPG